MGIISGLTKFFNKDSGQNPYQSRSFQAQAGSGYDPNAKNYLNVGGAPKANYGQADAYGNQASQAREGQQQATNLIMRRASGATPSIAGQQSAADFQRLQNQSRLDNQMLQQNARLQSQQAIAAQGAQAASARGTAGVALAGQNAANNIANTQGAIGQSTANAVQNMGLSNANAAQNISSQAQVNAAQERMQAEQAALGGYSTIRGADLSSQDLASRNAQFQAQQQARANEAQLNANMQEQQMLSNSYNTASTLEAQRRHANANRQGQTSDQVADDVGGFFDSAIGGMMMLSDTRAKRQLLLDQGRREGAAAAYGNDADPAALDDRFRQHQEYQQRQESPYSRFDSVDDELPQARQEDPVAQWERSFGSASQAETDASTRDNLAEAQKIRAGFERDDAQPGLSVGGQRATGRPWWAQQLGGIFSGGKGPPPKSDERAKEQVRREAFEQGAQTAAKFYTGDDVTWGEDGPTPVAETEAELAPAPNPLPPPTMRRAPGPEGAVEFSANRTRDDGPVHEVKYSRGPSLAEQISYDNLTKGAFDETQAAAYSDRYRTHGLALAQGRKTTGATHAAPARRRTMESDERAKKKGKETPDVVPLADDPVRGRLQMGSERAFYARPEDDDGRPSLSGRSAPAHLAEWSAEERRSSQAARQRKMTPAELSAEADRMMAGLRSDHESRMSRGPAVVPDDGPVADANRAMRGEPYAYRPEHTPPNERPGQPHFGFMAQNLERSPVSRVAVEEGPDGIKRVDRDRMLQVVAAGVADLQRQQDETRLALRRGGRR